MTKEKQTKEKTEKKEKHILDLFISTHKSWKEATAKHDATKKDALVYVKEHGEAHNESGKKLVHKKHNFTLVSYPTYNFSAVLEAKRREIKALEKHEIDAGVAKFKDQVEYLMLKENTKEA